VSAPANTNPDPVKDQPIYWFALLERAVERGNYTAAAECQRQLERLGVRVVYGRPTRRRRKEAAHVP
jgi:hypothetical protein